MRATITTMRSVNLTSVFEPSAAPYFWHDEQQGRAAGAVSAQSRMPSQGQRQCSERAGVGGGGGRVRASRISAMPASSCLSSKCENVDQNRCCTCANEGRDAVPTSRERKRQCKAATAVVPHTRTKDTGSGFSFFLRRCLLRTPQNTGGVLPRGRTMVIHHSSESDAA